MCACYHVLTASAISRYTICQLHTLFGLAKLNHSFFCLSFPVKGDYLVGSGENKFIDTCKIQVHHVHSLDADASNMLEISEKFIVTS